MLFKFLYNLKKSRLRQKVLRMLPLQRQDYQINGTNGNNLTGNQQEMPPERPPRRRTANRNAVAPVQATTVSPTLWVNDIEDFRHDAPRNNNVQELHI